MLQTYADIHEVVRRIRGEFLEMPGLRLTLEQAQRLWRLDRIACDAVLGALVDARFLARTRDGAFVLMELELIEPNLFFGFQDGSAERMGKAIAKRLL